MEELLKEYLNLFWLRPENALFMTFKTSSYNSLKFESPSLEISCGNGLVQAIRLGGKFSPDFDYFSYTTASNFSHTNFIDIFDNYDSEYSVDFVEKPKQKIDFGTDWKEDLLKKAEKTGIFENLVLHDNNKLPLPFEDNYFKTIYSNSIYWVKNMQGLLKDIHRISRNDATIGLQVMSPSIFETFEMFEKYFSEEAISILDRQRRSTMPSLKPFQEWKEIFENNGYRIENAVPTVPSKIINDIWNIGLRPISHLLIQMSDSLSVEDRRRIKKEWVEIFFELFKPLLNLPQSIPIDDSGYTYFELRKI